MSLGDSEMEIPPCPRKQRGDKDGAPFCLERKQLPIPVAQLHAAIDY
jgi:hypothetical protein